MRWIVTVFLAASLGLALLLYSLLPPPLPVPPRTDRILSGLTVIQPGIDRRLDHSVVIRDGRIAELRPRRADDPPPLCAGCFALPGLIDVHVHTPPRILLGNPRLFALLYLAHGVTTVRDLGESDAAVARMAAKLNAGEWVGPRMLRCGPVLDGDPPGWPMARVPKNPAEASAVVGELADDGVDCIKVYNELRPDVFAAIAAAARRHGLPLVGHVPHEVGLAGVRDFESQHLTGIPYLSRPRPPVGWDLRNEDVLALTDAEIETALALAQRQRVSFTPTLANFSLRLIASDPRRFPPPPAARWLPGFWHGNWGLIARFPETEAEIQAALDVVAPLRRITGRAHAHRIDVLAGTDTLMPWVIPGAALHHEIEELALALGSAEAALAAATTVSGRHLAPGELGVLRSGARADLLILPDDPTLNLAALGHWQIVVADGRLYERATTDAWLARYREHFHSTLYAGVMDRVVDYVAERFASPGAASR